MRGFGTWLFHFLIAGLAGASLWWYNCPHAETPAGGQAHEILVIRGGMLIDGTGGPPRADAIVVIRGDRIEAVFSEGQGSVPEGAKTIEARGATILPGLIDVHTHLTTGSAGSFTSLAEFAPERVFHDLRAYLYWGVTTIRSMTDMDWIIPLRERVNRGLILGPRILTTGPTFTAPGGHPARFFPEMVAAVATRQLSDPAAVRQEVRRLAEGRIDAVKVVYDGGHPRWTTFPKLSFEVLRAIIEEAHQKKLPVAVHTWQIREFKEALLAGADSLEHGAVDPLDDEAVRLLRQRKAFYCPTLTVHWSHIVNQKQVERLLDDPAVRKSVSSVILEGLRAKRGYYFSMRESSQLRAYFQDVYGQVRSNLRKVAAMGVPVVAGTDAGEPLVFHGWSLVQELKLMVEAGLRPIQAIEAATRNNALLLGLADQVGTVEPGKWADLLIVEGDPRASLDALRKIRVVVKAGRIINRATLLDEP
jgi:imidazolonepropionase-like amidohydrolase